MESDEQHKLIDQAKRLLDYLAIEYGGMLIDLDRGLWIRGEYLNRMRDLRNKAEQRYQRRHNRYYKQEA